MTEPRSTRIPTPLYAVAGAGDLAYQQLRRLPAVVTGLSDEATRSELREKAVATTADLREKAAATTAELREKAALTLRNANSGAANLRHRAVNGELDLDRLREATIRNAAVVVAGAQAAQERALAIYGELVARGERVVGSGVVQAADTVNADIETTEQPAVTATPASATAAGGSTAEVVEQVKAPAAANGTDPGATARTPAAKRRPATKSTRPPAKRTRPATDK